MNTYVKNLTDNLIGKHGFYSSYTKLGDDGDERVKFIKTVMLILSATDLNPATRGGMSAGTLGEIASQIEKGDVDLDVHYDWVVPSEYLDFWEFTRTSVAWALARIIYDRLQGRLQPAYGFRLIGPPRRIAQRKQF